MPLTVTVNTIAECLWTDCNILGDDDDHDTPAEAKGKHNTPHGLITTQLD
jgi:hypothetical protein